MRHIVANLQTKEIISREDILAFKEYIHRQYGELPPGRRAKLLADAVHRVLSGHLEEFEARWQTFIRTTILSQAFSEDRLTVRGDDVFWACVLLDDVQEQAFVSALARWVNRQQDEPVSPENLQQFVVQAKAQIEEQSLVLSRESVALLLDVWESQAATVEMPVSSIAWLETPDLAQWSKGLQHIQWPKTSELMQLWAIVKEEWPKKLKQLSWTHDMSTVIADIREWVLHMVSRFERNSLDFSCQVYGVALETVSRRRRRRIVNSVVAALVFLHFFTVHPVKGLFHDGPLAIGGTPTPDMIVSTMSEQQQKTFPGSSRSKVASPLPSSLQFKTYEASQIKEWIARHGSPLPMLDATLILQAKDSQWAYRPSDLGIQFLPADVVKSRLDVYGWKKTIFFSYEREQTAQILYTLSQEVYNKSDQTREIDIEEALKRIEETWLRGDFSPISLPVRYLNKRVSSYSTTYDGSQVGRTINVRLAAESLHGQRIEPGEVFSFNGVVGERTYSRGYREAKIIINNKFESGLGGGVCQVSSTLYNAISRVAGVDVVERNTHSLPVHYVPQGRDATVAWDSLDFRFQNTTDRPLLLETAVGGGSLTVSVWQVNE